MYKNKTFLAVIPARGGSKRLPMKNLLNLLGKPLIVWSIESAINSKYLDKVVVSTDDLKIADISKKAGAIVPFIRPSELATDTASTIDVILHLLNFIELNKENYDYIVLLQPTSPLRNSSDIDNAIMFCIEKDADSIISVCETVHSPLWANTLPSDLSMRDFLKPDIVNKRSQDLPIYYRLNGAIYIVKTELIKKEKTFFTQSNSYAFIMPKERSIDIDTELDFLIAETIINYRKRNE